jgi:hypothetical protein
MQIIAALLLVLFSAVSHAQGVMSDVSAATIDTAADDHEESTVTIEEEPSEAPVPMRWSLGTGFEARLQREVNPDYTEAAMLGELFVQMNRGHWGGQLEISQEERNTSSGALHIDTVTTNAGGWGRYTILLERPWHPYFTGGVGSYFDNVKSSYGSSSIEKNGRRLYWGLGVGISRTFWEHLLVEAEGRGALVEDRKDPVFSGLIRVGVQI